MIKNPVLLVLPLLVAAAAGCGTARAGATPEGFQGVVELETYALGFDVGGRVGDVAVKRGDRVEAGADLARLDDALLQAARAARALRESGSLPQAELDEVESRLARARAEREAADARVKMLASGSRREEIAVAEARVAAAAAAVALEDERVARKLA